MFVVDKTRIPSMELTSLEFTISGSNLSTQILTLSTQNLIIYMDNTSESILPKLKLKDYYTERMIFPKYLKI